MSGFWAGAAVMALACSGCSTVPRVGELPPELSNSAEQARYRQVLERASAHQELYGNGGLDTQAFLGTTVQSWPFREARLRRQAAFDAWPQAELERHLAAERAELDKGVDFFFGAYVRVPRFDDFDRRDSLWRLALVTDAGEVTPLSVERLGRGSSALSAYYPYVGDFWTAYRIRFPNVLPNGQPVLGPRTREVTLRVSSPLGKAELHVQAQ